MSAISFACSDVDAGKIEKLRRFEIPIHEPGLHQLVERNAAAGRLRFATDYDDAVSHATLILIAVGTPSGEDGSADLSHVIACAQELGKRIERDSLIVVKSTVPVGTNDQVRTAVRSELDRRRGQASVTTASNPEFLKEGFAVEDFMKPDRIIVGVDDAQSGRSNAGVICAVQPKPRSPDRDGYPLGGIHQVRRQLHARSAHFLHERDGKSG